MNIIEEPRFEYDLIRVEQTYIENNVHSPSKILQSKDRMRNVSKCFDPEDKLVNKDEVLCVKIQVCLADASIIFFFYS